MSAPVSATEVETATRWIEVAVVEMPTHYGRHDPRDTFGLVPENWESRKPGFIGESKVTRITEAGKINEVCNDLALRYMPAYSKRRIVMALFRQEEKQPFLIVILRDDAVFWLNHGM